MNTPQGATVPENTRLPASVTTKAGAAPYPGHSSAGNLSIQAPTTLPGNAADTTDDVLFVFTLPAGSFDQALRQLTLLAVGKLAANGNSKRAKIFVNPTTAAVGSAISGGTLIADTGASTGNNVAWELEVQITKQGVFGANTQFAVSNPIVGTAHGGVSVANLTLNEASAITFAVTGSSASSAANDVQGQMLDVSWAN